MECKYCNKICKNKNSLKQHEIRCLTNPNKIISQFSLYNEKLKIGEVIKEHSNQFTKALAEGTTVFVSDETKLKLSIVAKGRKQTDEQKKKTSDSMKKAHTEGRAWNIGKSRWNNEPSYPESFMMKVIENEFEDKNYVREFSVSIYSLDFAWIEKKKVIEIDGAQHERFQEYKDRDERKDSLLKDLGWQVLRIKWKDLYHDPKAWILKAKEFIE